jgi:ubiquinone/menaquinone biosynthesis C-methylase UbiE
MGASQLNDDMQEWLRSAGERFVRDIGIRAGDIVLDFGCGAGNYTVPLAKCAGEQGAVYAFDMDRAALNKAADVAREARIGNAIFLNGHTRVPLKNASVDATMCYDAIHYAKTRTDIYREFRRVLKPGGLLSLYPKHSKNDYPLMELADVDVDEIVGEIEGLGFALERRFSETLVHDNSYTMGCVLNFRTD